MYKAGRVPEFYGDAERTEMTSWQESFYRLDFLPGLRAGRPVDVEGNSGYIGELMFELMEQRRKEPIMARETLVTLLAAYGRGDQPYYAARVLADFYFLEGDFAAGYRSLGSRVDPSLHLSLAPHIGHLR